MTKYRNRLPQLDGGLFLNDAGLETDLIFNHGIDIPEFAAHTLLDDEDGRAALQRYMEGFLSLANETGAGFVLDTQTWRAQTHFSEELGQDASALRKANLAAVEFAATLRDKYASNAGQIVINGLIGPRGDAYAPDEEIAAMEAQAYHGEQLGWLAETDVDMVTALTFTQADEAIGVVRAAVDLGLPVVVSFTVETDGNLPTGQPLAEAIATVDAATDAAAAYFMVNCAHPDHFVGLMVDQPWAHRIRGLRCNASRMSHAELDEAEVLDDGNPAELAAGYARLKTTLPWLNVFGGCCGSDLRHVTAIAAAVSE
ncbi:MAG: S-methylmethionine-dependent homocysteine/selenocysteine methylase [Verrucomicrobiales bacterium]|jgi:S-methylmethionine-dependent homocysteine/selenocysteine methylase